MGNMIFYSLIFGLFIVLIIFITLDKSLSGTLLPNTIADLNNTNTSFSQNVKGTVQVMESTWTYIPLFALFGLIYYGLSIGRGGV